MLQATVVDPPESIGIRTSAAPSDLDRMLAALGPMLRIAHAPVAVPLSGWSAVCRIDGDGPREGIELGPDGREYLYLLPDSDYLAWEVLVASLPASARAHTAASAWTRGKRPLPMRPRIATPVRVEPGRIGRFRPQPLLSLSAVGLEVARRIAAAERARLLGDGPISTTC